MTISVGTRYMYATVQEIKVVSGETVIVWKFDDGDIVETGLDVLDLKKAF